MLNLIKKICIQINYTDTTDIINIIKKSKVKIVSFDIFDTLIKRNVRTPQDVFELLEKSFNNEFDKRVSIKELRIIAEKKANANTQSEDVSLKEVYHEFDEINDLEREWLYKHEILIEKEICQINYKIKKVYDWCVNNNIEVIAISDMYLPYECIKEILLKSGYDKISHIYISSEKRLRKSTGNLFKLVLREYKIEPYQLLHIGDAYRGDYYMPKKLKIKTVLIKSDIGNTCFFNLDYIKQSKDVEYGIINSFIKNNEDNSFDYLEKIGYEVVGPILYGYCKWLSKKIKEDRIEKVFFLAREGYMLEKAFEIYDEDNVFHKVIKVSRHATLVPLLFQEKSFGGIVHKITVPRGKYKLKEFLQSCSINDIEIEEIVKKNGFDLDDDINRMSDCEKNSLYSCLEKYIKINSKEQYKFIREYLKQMNFMGNIAVCDVGWHGTIQQALENIFPENSIKGFYIGKKSYKTKNKSKAEAFLFDDSEFYEDIRDDIMSAPDLFELFFLSTDGTTRGYKKVNNEIKVIQEKPDQTEENSKEIIKLQNASYKFIRDFSKVEKKFDLDLSPYACEAAYKKMIDPPTNELIKVLKGFTFYNINDKHFMTAEHTILYYIIHPTRLVDDFLKSGSKVIFLRSVFKLPLPYSKIISFARKFDNK